LGSTSSTTTTTSQITNETETEATLNYKKRRRHLIYQCHYYTEALRKFYCLYSTVPLTTDISVRQQHAWYHYCKPSCEFYQVDNELYICRHSQNMHRCTATECNSIQHTDDADICLLTNNRYTPEFANLSYNEKQETGCDIHSSTITTTSTNTNIINPLSFSTPSSSSSRPSSKRFKRANNAATNEMRQRAIAAVHQTFSQNEKFKHQLPQLLTTRKLDHVQDKQNETHNLEATAHTFLTALLPHPIVPTILSQVKSIIIRLWRLIVQTPTFIIKCFQYRFEYHILVVLGELNKNHSFQVQSKIIIPHIKQLTNQITFIGRLCTNRLPILHTNGLTSRGYTNCKSLFRDCIGQCINKL
jgi:hypothetical protein